MKNILRPLGAALAGITAALLVSSCYSDPYYGSTSISAGYSDGGGYGDGYGYGSSRFSTSLFVSTGNPTWGYDPYVQSYYDYKRRAYYDPYLYGYYPVGYRPPVLVGCPHPYGYRAGNYCPPPRVIRYNTVPNYRNREYGYRASNYDWARQVRTKPVVNRPQETRPSVRQGGQNLNNSRPSESKYQNRPPSTRSPQTNSRSPQANTRTPQTNSRSPQTNTRTPQASPPRSPQTYVNQRNVETRNPTRNTQNQTETRANTRTTKPQATRTTKPQAAPPARNQRTEETKKDEEERKNRKEESRNVRGLGQSRR